MSDTSDQIGIAPEAEPEAAKTVPQPGPATNPDSTASISATIPAELHDLVKVRADEEDRTVSALIKRALTAFMKDWQPGDSD